LAEAKVVTKAIENTKVAFLFEEIFVIFGVLKLIVTNKGAQFTSKLVRDLTENYKIRHRKSTPYHPQANEQVEAINEVLENEMTKIVQLNRKDCSKKLRDALSAYKITWKNTNGFSPYQLVHGKECLLPIELEVHTFKLLAELGLELSDT